MSAWDLEIANRRRRSRELVQYEGYGTWWQWLRAWMPRIG